MVERGDGRGIVLNYITYPVEWTSPEGDLYLEAAPNDPFFPPGVAQFEAMTGQLLYGAASPQPKITSQVLSLPVYENNFRSAGKGEALAVRTAMAPLPCSSLPGRLRAR